MAPSNKKYKSNKDNRDYYMFGLHAVKAAIENPYRKKHELWISQNARTKIFTSLKPPSIPIFNLDKSKSLPISENNVHQGAILKVSPLKQPADIHEINKSNQPKLVVVLDKVSDPQNVGAIIRSSLFFNCNAIINTINGGSSENGSLVKAASGAFEQARYVEVTNIVQTIIKLKKIGYFVIGLDEKSRDKISSITKEKGDIAVVFGAEGKGIRRLTREHCDQLVSIDGNHSFSSLNVSTAVGITLFKMQSNSFNRK
ncbi:23S rRNA (guanosine(2251)-2'-O)-methyltransferase RlmB [Paracoccaceae bacterium]|nr:23S rRNA (guanosine(2251)-2'-O)-methyltransferase RlmB [Paracoccaceae bacterium]